MPLQAAGNDTLSNTTSGSAVPASEPCSIREYVPVLPVMAVSRGPTVAVPAVAVQDQLSFVVPSKPLDRRV